ncbi:MAG: hypothetical protein EKK55_12235 [Rhodocyclaceae bacterium]|nr:MAG: hypothetical protein EKK55_12235 [Rhodocyclaceae bacterium]
MADGQPLSVVRDSRLRVVDARGRILSDRTAQVSVTATTSTSDMRTIAPSGSWTVDLGGVSAVKMVHIESEAPALTLTLNGGDPVTIAPLSTATPALVHLEGTFTSVVIGNPSATTSAVVAVVTAA